jgi:hypothetical protein
MRALWRGCCLEDARSSEHKICTHLLGIKTERLKMRKDETLSKCPRVVMTSVRTVAWISAVTAWDEELFALTWFQKIRFTGKYVEDYEIVVTACSPVQEYRCFKSIHPPIWWGQVNSETSVHLQYMGHNSRRQSSRLKWVCFIFTSKELYSVRACERVEV